MCDCTSNWPGLFMTAILGTEDECMRILQLITTVAYLTSVYNYLVQFYSLQFTSCNSVVIWPELDSQ